MPHVQLVLFVDFVWMAASFKVSLDAADEFLIVATDGLW